MTRPRCVSPIARRACETARFSEPGVTTVSGQSVVEDLVRGHHAFTLAQEQREQRERLGLDRDRPPLAAELTAGLVELVRTEPVEHAPNLYASGFLRDDERLARRGAAPILARTSRATAGAAITTARPPATRPRRGARARAARTSACAARQRR